MKETKSAQLLHVFQVNLKVLIYFNNSLKNQGHPGLGEQWEVVPVEEEDKQRVPIALQAFSNVS